ncbi:MAG: NAD(P)H-dependent oxidoreductase [Candidatus Melainabacteria bacterium]|nr:NAD(P)H-dependent oxidoreductase [Candidatus Melainabacteria bacterium]
MKTLAVLAHPERKSFNGAMYDVAKDVFSQPGHEFKGSDLYRMNFDPVSDRRNFTTIADPEYFKQQAEEVHAAKHNTFSPDIALEIEKLYWCDLLIFQFPLWWFSVPAIMKGWVDRVFAMGKIYDEGLWYEKGILKGKKAMLSLTTGAGEEEFQPGAGHGDINQVLAPLNHGIFGFVGCEILPPFIAWSAAQKTDAERRIYLEQYREVLSKIK